MIVDRLARLAQVLTGRCVELALAGCLVFGVGAATVPVVAEDATVSAETSFVPEGALAQNLATIEKGVYADTAHDAVEIATGEVLQLIARGQEYAEEDPERFYVEVEALLNPLIDFRRFSRNVMGKHNRCASDAQRDRFADSFKWSLVRTYALALTEFHDGEVEVLPPRREPRDPNKVNVTQEIKYEGRTYVVVYRMQRKDEQRWSLNNLIIEGVNIGLNYKSQFDGAVKEPKCADLDKVIDEWTEFVANEEAVGVEAG